MAEYHDQTKDGVATPHAEGALDTSELIEAVVEDILAEEIYSISPIRSRAQSGAHLRDVVRSRATSDARMHAVSAEADAQGPEGSGLNMHSMSEAIVEECTSLERSTRSRAASGARLLDVVSAQAPTAPQVVPPSTTVDCICNVSLDPTKKYYLYVSFNFCSSEGTDMLSGYERLWICGERAKDLPKNFIHILPPAPVPGNDTKLKMTQLVLLALQNGVVGDTVNQILSQQGELLVKGYTSNGMDPIMHFDPRLRCFGLAPAQQHFLDNKCFQMGFLSGKVAVPKHVTCTVAAAPEHYDAIASPAGVFVGLEYGSAGSAVYHFHNKGELETFCNSHPSPTLLNLVEWMELSHSVSSDVIIASAEEVIVYGVIEQVFDAETKMKCMGSNYPARISEDDYAEVVAISRQIGVCLCELGIRGYISLDISKNGLDGKWYFTEINARYPGSISERLYLMELTRPAGHPTIMDLELSAIEHGTFGDHTIWPEPKNVCFSRRRVLAGEDMAVGDPAVSVIDAVKKILETFTHAQLFEVEMDAFKAGYGCAFVGYVGDGAHARKGSTIGKLVFVGTTAEERDALVHMISVAVWKVLPGVLIGA